jgi:hypothetical protein
MKTFLNVFFALFLCATGWGAADPATVSVETAFEFETHFLPKGDAPSDTLSKWRMWRSKTEVEVWQIGSKDGEVWGLDGAGGVMFKRIFHPERTEVVFTAMDLKVIGHPVDWERCFSLVSRKFIEEFLKPAGKESFQSQELESFEGEAQGSRWRVLWSDSLQMAVQVRVENDKGTSITKLSESHPLAEQPWQRLRERGYQAMDFSDLGDSENDPTVKRLMRRMGMKCTHGSCGSVCLIPK